MALKVEKNKVLADFSTFKIGGPAEYFVRVENEKELIEAVRFAKEKRLPFFVLGGGSNILFSDRGFRGLVVKIQNEKCQVQDTKIIAGTGCPLQKLVQEGIERGLAGLEFAAGIPGTLGGAIWGNAGAFGGEMKDVVKKVRVFQIMADSWQIEEFKNKDCQFGYRDSIFKRKKNWIILEATLKLKRGNKVKLKKKIKEILKIRKEKQPLEFPSAGSVFKNVPLEKAPKEVREKFRDKIKNKLLPAAVLIEAAGLKGKRVDGAKISEKHANFILNFKNATAEAVLALIMLAKKKVREKFRVELEEEIQLIEF